MSRLRVRQIRSGIGTKPKHRGTLRSLGLGRIGKTRTLPDRPEIRGMIAKVPHLVSVEEVGEDQTPTKPAATTKRATSARGVEGAVGGGEAASSRAKE